MHSSEVLAAVVLTAARELLWASAFFLHLFEAVFAVLLLSLWALAAALEAAPAASASSSKISAAAAFATFLFFWAFLTLTAFLGVLLTFLAWTLGRSMTHLHLGEVVSLLLWNVFNVLGRVGGDLHFPGEHGHLGFFNFLDFLSGLLLLGLARSDSGAKVADVSVVFFAYSDRLGLLAQISKLGELLLVDRVFRLFELLRSTLCEVDACAALLGGARLEAVHVHACTACLGASGRLSDDLLGGWLLAGLLVETAPAEHVLLLLFVFLALGGFDLLGILDDGGVLVKLDLGLFVRGLREVLLLRLGWLRKFVLFVIRAVASLAAGGCGNCASRLSLLGLLLLASLLLKQVLNNLFLVTHR